MVASASGDSFEQMIGQWRTYVRRHPSIHPRDVDELESHLRDQAAALVSVGLAADEAFLVAIKRIGNLDALSREFAREHSERLWKQLVLVPDASSEPGHSAFQDRIVMVGLAAGAALAIKIPELFGLHLLRHGQQVYTRNLSLFVLPLRSHRDAHGAAFADRPVVGRGACVRGRALAHEQWAHALRPV